MKKLKSNLPSPFCISMLLGITMTFSVISFAQNHNPEFDASSIHIEADGSDYVLIPADANTPAMRTKVTMRYRNDDEPIEGETKLEWASGNKINVFESNAKDPLGLPHIWSGTNQGVKNLELEAKQTATPGAKQTLQATYTDKEGKSSPPGKRDFTLLKVDLDIFEPNVPFVGFSRPAPIEIPEDEQDDPNRCQILINNDNDDLDSLFNGPAIADPYPQDNDDEVLKLRDPIGFGHPTDDDDVVLVTLRQFNGVNTGRIKLTTSRNEDVRLFKYEEGEYELDAVSFNDLEVDLSSPGTESPLKDLPNEDVSFYVEGINANDNLTVSMIFEDANKNELARQEVHLKIKDVEQTIGLVAIAHDSLSKSAVKSYLTEHIQGANAVRYDRDGLDADADTIVPVLFKLEALLQADSAHPDWDDVTYGTSGSANELTGVLNFISQVTVGAHIYVTGEIERHDNTVFPSGVTQLGSEKGMCVALHKFSSRVISHEWLHAYGNLDHQCVDLHLMTGNIIGQPPCKADPGYDTRQNESDLIMNYDW